ncbi:MAG: cysteine dioxygenase [Asticcacaulis sp.]
MPHPVGSPNLAPLRDFVRTLTRLTHDSDLSDREIQSAAIAPLKALIRTDDWLPDAFAQPHPEYYQQYLLHCDPLERFSVVSFVWGPGQSTPVHNHTVWGLVGVLRGAEQVETYAPDADGHLVCAGAGVRLKAGDLDHFGPNDNDVHRVSNAAEGVSVSIHVYGANIGAVHRSVFKPDGTIRPFVSGYANTTTPNLWDRSKS